MGPDTDSLAQKPPPDMVLDRDGAFFYLQFAVNIVCEDGDKRRRNPLSSHIFMGGS